MLDSNIIKIREPILSDKVIDAYPDTIDALLHDSVVVTKVSALEMPKPTPSQKIRRFVYLSNVFRIVSLTVCADYDRKVLSFQCETVDNDPNQIEFKYEMYVPELASVSDVGMLRYLPRALSEVIDDRSQCILDIINFQNEAHGDVPRGHGMGINSLYSNAKYYRDLQQLFPAYAVKI